MAKKVMLCLNFWALFHNFFFCIYLNFINTEMAAQEKYVDSLIDLAKHDQVHEKLSMEAIESCCAYFCMIYGSYFGKQDVTNQARLVVIGTR